MGDRKEIKQTIVFIGFLILSGVCYLFTGTDSLFLNTVMFSANFLIYAGLLLYWIQSVRTRLLPTTARAYILAAAFLMLFYLTLRVFKYRIAEADAIPSRVAVYAYWIPQVMIPTLFLMTCIRMRRGERESDTHREMLLLIPAMALSLMVMTNDLHGLVYSPKVGLSQFAVKTGTYSLGLGFYLMYVWMGLTALAGFILLFLETRKRPVRMTVMLIVVLAIWVTLILLCILFFNKHRIPAMFNVPEVHIFCMLGVTEICIRERLIPYNENHSGFFSQLDLPVMIADKRFAPVYKSAVPIAATTKQLSASVTAPICLDDDTRLSGMPIQAGYAFWTEDETELHRENRRLEAANDILSEENDLIAVENKLKEKQAHYEAQNQVYDKIARALYPKQKKIEKLLANVEPDTPAFHKALAECCVYNAYSKRKSNLILLSEETLPKSNRELFLSLQESARFLECCGIQAAAVGEEYSDLPLSAIHDLYDTFETVIEAYLPYMKRMTASLTKSGIRLAIEAQRDPDLPPTLLPVERKSSDDLTFLTINATGGGGV